MSHFAVKLVKNDNMFEITNINCFLKEYTSKMCTSVYNICTLLSNNKNKSSMLI